MSQPPAATGGLGFALFGAGRIGHVHAAAIAASDRARLACVYDVDAGAATALAGRYGVPVAGSVEAALATAGADAVLIASSTPTHLDLMLAATAAGRPTLCEKPLDLDLAAVDRRRDEILGTEVPVQIGFQRRYDSGHANLFRELRAGAVGELQQVVVTSRDPGPPPAEYLAVSGGLFRDMMIHDFDVARWLTGEEPEQLAAFGAPLLDADAQALDDVDTAMVILRMPSGVQCHINCARQAPYGYDQRIEVLGASGMLISANLYQTGLQRFTATGTTVRDRLVDFFLERYADAYRAEMDDFVDAVLSGRAPAVGYDDGRQALALADAADRSRRSGQTVRPAPLANAASS